MINVNAVINVRESGKSKPPPDGLAATLGKIAALAASQEAAKPWSRTENEIHVNACA